MGLDLSLVTVDEEQVGRLQGDLAPLIEKAKSIEIVTVDDYTKVEGLLKQCAEKKNIIVEYFKPLKKQADALHADICAKEKEALAPVITFRTIVDPKVKTYLWNEEQKRLAAQKKIDDEARAAQDKLNKEAEALAKKAERRGDTDQATAIRNTVPTVSSVKVASVIPKSGISTKEIWKGTILDVKKVPRKLLEEIAIAYGIAMKKTGFDGTKEDYPVLNDYAKRSQGKLNIPGVKFFTETSLAVRTK